MKIDNRVMWLRLLPLVVVVGVLPLVVRQVVVDIAPSLGGLYGLDAWSDFFSQGKAALLRVVALMMVVGVLLWGDVRWLRGDRWTEVSLVSFVVYLVLVWLAALLSPWRDVALWGLPMRAEGVVTVSCYVVVMLYAVFAVRSIGDVRRGVLLPLAAVVIVEFALGVGQYAGYDVLLETDFGRWLISSRDLDSEFLAANELVAKGKIFGTMHHYNYMGSFVSVVVPLFVVLALCYRGRYRMVCVGAAVLGVCLMLLCGADSGLVAVAMVLTLSFAVFWRMVVRYRAVVLSCLMAGGVGFAALALALGDGKESLLTRVRVMGEEALELVLPTNDAKDYGDFLPVHDLWIDGGEAFVIDLKGGRQLRVLFDGNRISVEDGTSGEALDLVGRNGGSSIAFRDESLRSITFDVIDVRLGVRGLIMRFDKLAIVIVAHDEPEGMYFANLKSGEPMKIEKAESIGFKGKEKLGSARGYVWSRSLPLLVESPWIGSGAETYVLRFPQGDVLAKWHLYGRPFMITNKPHNMYLQIAINDGGLALIAFLLGVGAYLLGSLRLYWLRREYNEEQIAGVACFLAVVGYLSAGLFNDSVISVAPIFWVVLGCGIAINRLVLRKSFS